MQFSVNSTFLFIVAGIVILFVLAQSFFFLIRAYRRAAAIGMDMKQVRGSITSTAIFTIAPAISILLGVITLSKFLGLPLPWVRLSVVGAITYELPAATSAASALGISISETVTNPEVFSTIAWVMTLGIIPGLILVPTLLKRIQGGIGNMKQRDAKWGDLFTTSLFLGMISAFSGLVFADIRNGLEGWIPVFVLLFSAMIMGICGLIVNRFKIRWVETYALPISMLSGMAFAMVITPLIQG